MKCKYNAKIINKNSDNLNKIHKIQKKEISNCKNN